MVEVGRHFQALDEYATGTAWSKSGLEDHVVTRPSSKGRELKESQPCHVRR